MPPLCMAARDHHPAVRCWRRCSAGRGIILRGLIHVPGFRLSRFQLAGLLQEGLPCQGPHLRAGGDDFLGDDEPLSYQHVRRWAAAHPANRRARRGTINWGRSPARHWEPLISQVPCGETNQTLAPNRPVVAGPKQYFTGADHIAAAVSPRPKAAAPGNSPPADLWGPMKPRLSFRPFDHTTRATPRLSNASHCRASASLCPD